MKNGIYVVGTFLGFESLPWSTDPNKFNHQIGIRTGQYDSGFGQMVDELARVDVFTDEAINWLRQNASKLVGKEVYVPVVYRARDGKRGAWLSCFMPKNELPKLMDKPVKEVA